MNKDFDANGFVVLENIFTLEEAQKMRELSLKFFKEGGGFNNSRGKAKPDWIKEDNLQELFQIIQSKKFESIIEKEVGEKIELTNHNDLHLNRTVGWHKDRLNGEARQFEINSPWEQVSGQTMKIYKLDIYLQDHATNEDALTVRVGSHKSEHGKRGIIKVLKPKMGDVVIVDQRISHRGQWSGGYDRVLVCLGYGVRNCFFEQFQKGTKFRQDKQNERQKTTITNGKMPDEQLNKFK